MIIVESASITDKGKKRAANEDALILEDALGLYVVADGMGGHRAGDIASRLVVETIGEYIKNSIDNDDCDQTVDFDETLSREANRLLSSIRMSNQVVHAASLKNRSCRGMGSTVSAIYFTESTLIAANVGDSPFIWFATVKSSCCRYLTHCWQNRKRLTQKMPKNWEWNSDTC